MLQLVASSRTNSSQKISHRNSKLLIKKAKLESYFNNSSYIKPFDKSVQDIDSASIALTSPSLFNELQHTNSKTIYSASHSPIKRNSIDSLADITIEEDYEKLCFYGVCEIGIQTEDIFASSKSTIAGKS